MRLSCVNSSVNIPYTQILLSNKFLPLKLMEQLASVKNAFAKHRSTTEPQKDNQSVSVAKIIGAMADKLMPSDDAELSPDALRSRQWKTPTESLFLLQQMARQGFGPRQILATLYPRYCSSISDHVPDEWIMQLLRELCEQRTRQKLGQYNTFQDAVELFRKSNRILVITGAGVSVSCGIPDFRSENGVYARLKKDFPELPTPAAMFDIDFFRHNPRPFYNFAREIFPGQFRPSLSHMFIKFLEEENKLLRNYTQNIDTLERIADISNLVECHGSFARATCLDCKHQVDAEQIRGYVYAQRVAHCPQCMTGVLKPDIVFFGEDLGDAFHNQMGTDHTQLDLLVVIGSSMQVRPVALIPFNIPEDVPQILVNRELLRNYAADIKLLGSCDPILVQIALAMGGQMREKMLNELHLRQNAVRPGEVSLPSDLLACVDQLLLVHRQTAQIDGTNTDNNTKTKLEKEEGHKDKKETFSPRQITVDQFKQLIIASDNDNNKKKVEDEEQEEGTARKRSKMIEMDQQERGKDQDTVGQQQRAQTALWQSNYALVEAHLPSTDTTLFVPPNLNVFVGAELYYDRDQDTFVHRMGIKERKWDQEDGDEFDGPNAGDHCWGSDDEDYETTSSSSSSSSRCTSSSTGKRRGNASLPDRRHHHHTAKSSQKQRKADSCPPAIPSDKWPKK